VTALFKEIASYVLLAVAIFVAPLLAASFG
jgi:hypothetical protein